MKIPTSAVCARVTCCVLVLGTASTLRGESIGLTTSFPDVTLGTAGVSYDADPLNPIFSLTGTPTEFTASPGNVVTFDAGSFKIEAHVNASGGLTGGTVDFAGHLNTGEEISFGGSLERFGFDEGDAENDPSPLFEFTYQITRSTGMGSGFTHGGVIAWIPGANYAGTFHDAFNGSDGTADAFSLPTAVPLPGVLPSAAALLVLVGFHQLIERRRRLAR